MKELYSIYNNWGHYDELGDKVELTEAMVLSELDTLAKWQKKFDLHFDYFQIDCLWFDPDKGYHHFRKPHWPEGPDRVLQRIRDLNMIPGLWYSTNSGRLNVPEWEPSRNTDNWSYNLADGPYGDAFEKALFFAAEQWGIRFFKLDFAHLQVVTKGVNRSEVENYHLSVRRLKEIFGRLKASCPDIRVITHCGYARKNQSKVIGHSDQFEVDTGWLDIFDRMFSGDPAATDAPQTDMIRNSDLFQDHQVWKLHQAGFPLHRIEDHGAVMGTTNTAMYRGRKGFRRTYIGQLARGNRRDFLYGDPTVLTDNDAQFMKKARSLFFNAYQSGLWTRFLGPGEPVVTPWHSYLTGGGDSGLLYIVNSQLTTQYIELPLLNCFKAKVLFYDGSTAPDVQCQPEFLHIELRPEQMAIIGLGTYADSNWDLGTDTDSPAPRESHLLPLTFSPTPNGLQGELAPLQSSEDLLIVAQAIDSDPMGRLHAPPFRFGKQATRETDDMSPHAQDQLKITVTANDEELSPKRLIPDVPIWSGISWVARLYSIDSPVKIDVQQNLESPKRIRVRAYRVRWE